MKCTICEFACRIPENGVGRCNMVENSGGIIKERFPDRYLVSIPAPIEAMPMVHYHPNARFLQICTIGCNFRCPGCVSWLLTESPESVQGAVEKIPPRELVQRALDQRCRGIMFCFNEPIVSFFTFRAVARLARENNLVIGCTTNGYFTREAFLDLTRDIDFINFGIKGHSEETYRSLGAVSYKPVYRNMAIAVDQGLHTEVAAVFIKGREGEVLETARHVASVSRDIPFLVMRFLPFSSAPDSDEPSIREAEDLCSRLSRILDHVYLFNSPGTPYLNSDCPECGRTIIRRGFNGPMCANVMEWQDDGRCGCGYRLPVKGELCRDNGLEPLGYFGGYKTIMSLEGIRTILAFLGEHDSRTISRVLHEIIKTDFIKDLYPRMKQIGSYLDTVDHYAAIAGRMNEARKLRSFIESRVADIRRRVARLDRPRVYFALNHPLIAVFGDKFECTLVETAGGYCVNRDIDREEVPGIKIPPALLNELNPEIVFIHGAKGCPVSDFRTFARSNGIRINALETGRVYNVHPYRITGAPDWILGLMFLAGAIHPETCRFDLDDMSDQFYGMLFGMTRHDLNPYSNQRIDVLALEKINKKNQPVP